MQLSPRAFYRLTWGQYNCRVRGWLRREEEQWEHTRTLLTLYHNMNVKEADRKPAAKLLPLRKDRRARTLLPAAPVVDREALIAAIKKRDNLT